MTQTTELIHVCFACGKTIDCAGNVVIAVVPPDPVNTSHGICKACSKRLLDSYRKNQPKQEAA